MRLSSLYIRATKKAEKKRIEKMAESVKTSVESIAEVLFIFTHTYPDMSDLLDGGLGAWKAAMRRFMETLPPITEWNDVETALGSWYMASFVTSLGFESKKEGPPDGTINFREAGAEDGVGYILDVVSTMICHFHFTEMQAWSTPLIKARAYASWYIMATFPVELDGLGYIGQEAEWQSKQKRPRNRRF